MINGLRSTVMANVEKEIVKRESGNQIMDTSFIRNQREDNHLVTFDSEIPSPFYHLHDTVVLVFLLLVPASSFFVDLIQNATIEERVSLLEILVVEIQVTEVDGS